MWCVWVSEWVSESFNEFVNWPVTYITIFTATAITGSALSIKLKDYPTSARRKRSITGETTYQDINGW